MNVRSSSLEEVQGVMGCAQSSSLCEHVYNQVFGTVKLFRWAEHNLDKKLLSKTIVYDFSFCRMLCGG